MKRFSLAFFVLASAVSAGAQDGAYYDSGGLNVWVPPVDTQVYELPVDMPEVAVDTPQVAVDPVAQTVDMGTEMTVADQSLSTVIDEMDTGGGDLSLQDKALALSVSGLKNQGKDFALSASIKALNSKGTDFKIGTTLGKVGTTVGAVKDMPVTTPASPLVGFNWLPQAAPANNVFEVPHLIPGQGTQFDGALSNVCAPIVNMLISGSWQTFALGLFAFCGIIGITWRGIQLIWGQAELGRVVFSLMFRGFVAVACFFVVVPWLPIILTHVMNGVSNWAASMTAGNTLYGVRASIQSAQMENNYFQQALMRELSSQIDRELTTGTGHQFFARYPSLANRAGFIATLKYGFPLIDYNARSVAGTGYSGNDYDGMQVLGSSSVFGPVVMPPNSGYVDVNGLYTPVALITGYSKLSNRVSSTDTSVPNASVYQVFPAGASQPSATVATWSHVGPPNGVVGGSSSGPFQTRSYSDALVVATDDVMRAENALETQYSAAMARGDYGAAQGLVDAFNGFNLPLYRLQCRLISDTYLRDYVAFQFNIHDVTIPGAGAAAANDAQNAPFVPTPMGMMPAAQPASTPGVVQRGAAAAAHFKEISDLVHNTLLGMKNHSNHVLSDYVAPMGLGLLSVYATFAIWLLPVGMTFWSAFYMLPEELEWADALKKSLGYMIVLVLMPLFAGLVVNLTSMFVYEIAMQSTSGAWGSLSTTVNMGIAANLVPSGGGPLSFLGAAAAAVDAKLLDEAYSDPSDAVNVFVAAAYVIGFLVIVALPKITSAIVFGTGGAVEQMLGKAQIGAGIAGGGLVMGAKGAVNFGGAAYNSQPTGAPPPPPPAPPVQPIQL